jgi:hypothetical protein
MSIITKVIIGKKYTEKKFLRLVSNILDLI